MLNSRFKYTLRQPGWEKTVHFETKGSGDIEDIRPHIKDDQFYYAMVQVGQTLNKNVYTFKSCLLNLCRKQNMRPMTPVIKHIRPWVVENSGPRQALFLSWMSSICCSQRLHIWSHTVPFSKTPEPAPTRRNIFTAPLVIWPNIKMDPWLILALFCSLENSLAVSENK